MALNRRVLGILLFLGLMPAIVQAGPSAGRILVDPLISKVAPLSEGAKWFKALYQGTEPLLKVILTP